MKWMRTIVLVAAALALGLGVYYSERRSADREREAALAMRLMRFAPGDVDSIKITAAGDTLSGRRDSTYGWMALLPVPWPGDPSTWERVIGMVTGTDKIREWRVTKDSIAAYGLEPPLFRVVFFLKSAPPETLDIGRGAPVDQNGYVRVGSRSDTVILVPINLHTSIVRNIYDFRDRTLLRGFDPGLVRKIEIIRGATATTIARAGDRWQMQQPVRRFVDIDSMNAVFAKLNEARVSMYHDKPTDLAEYGLANPAAELRITSGGVVGTPTVHRVLLGKPTGRPGSTPTGFALDPARPVSVLEVPEKFLYQAMRPMANLWDRRLAGYQRHLVNRLRIITPRDSMTVWADSVSVWHFAPPDTGTAQRFRVNQIVAEVDNARMKDFTGAQSPGPAALTLEFFHNDVPQGRVVFGRAAGNSVLVQGTSSGEVGLLGKDVFDRIMEAVNDLPDRLAATAAR